MNKSYFSAWTSIDLSKDDSTKTDDKLGFVKGIVSSEIEDQAGDIIKQDGIDWSYFLDKGYFNWEHQSGPENILGYPTKIIKGDAETSVEGYLFLDRPKAKDAYDMAKILKDVQAPRSIGFSIEGQVIERDKANENIITKAKILNVSVTAHPCNPDAKLMVKALADMEETMRKKATIEPTLLKNLEEDEAKKTEAQANMAQTEDEKKAYATVEDAQKTQVEETQKNDDAEPKADDQGSKKDDQEAKKVEDEQAEKAQISKSEDDEDDMNKAEDSSVGEDSSLGEDDDEDDDSLEDSSVDMDDLIGDIEASYNYLASLLLALKTEMQKQGGYKVGYAKKSIPDLSIVSSRDLLSRIQKHFPTMSEDQLKSITRKCTDIIREYFVKD